MELYKYCDKHGLNILRHKALKISSIDEFSDPYEFRIAKNDNEIINKAVEAVYNFQREFYRVICFSSKYNNLILWSHYSINHTGILIKFDTDMIDANGNDKLTHYLQKVDYRDDMIVIPPNFLELSKKEQGKIIYKNTYTKYNDWIYEDEYRAIVSFDHAENKRYIDLNAGSILEVILGLNCDLETELSIIDILKRDEYKHVKFNRAVLHDRKYMMNYVVMNT
jgi:hypothetical protein